MSFVEHKGGCQVWSCSGGLCPSLFSLILQQNTRVRILSLRSCDIDDECMIALAKGMKVKQSATFSVHFVLEQHQPDSLGLGQE